MVPPQPLTPSAAYGPPLEKNPVGAPAHYAMLYPQNGDRIVAIDSVTSPYDRMVCACGRRLVW